MTDDGGDFVSWDDLFNIVYDIFRTRNVALSTCRSVTEALLMAESSGAYGHGLSRVSVYAGQIDSGRIKADASPVVEEVTPVMQRIDGDRGFAYPCIDLAIEVLAEVVKNYGLGIVGIYRSNHFGQAGWHCERLAHKGVTSLMFGNTAGAMSLWEGNKRVLGTNPIAFSTPHPQGGEPLVIDISLSKVARGKILQAKQEGGKIPDGWALDKGGQPTRDVAAALDGLMVPMGGYKGVALAVMVELLSLSAGGNLSHNIHSQLGSDGEPPDIGHCLIGFDANRLSGGAYRENFEQFLSLCNEDENARLPGISRLVERAKVREKGFWVKRKRLANLKSLACTPPSF